MRCPYCAEEVQDEAKKCRYCGEWFVRGTGSFSSEEVKEIKEAAPGFKKATISWPWLGAIVMFSLIAGWYVADVSVDLVQRAYEGALNENDRAVLDAYCVEDPDKCQALQFQRVGWITGPGTALLGIFLTRNIWRRVRMAQQD